jgi:hypothetical protein
MEESLTAAEPDERRAKDRRQRRFSLVVRERRSGFDRRGLGSAGRFSAAYERALLALRDRPRVVLAILLMVNALNLADFLLTMNVLSKGGGEANPIMRSLFAMDPLYAGIFKMVAVFSTSWLTWRCRRFRSGLQVAIILLALFTAVICYHLFGLVAYS